MSNRFNNRIQDGLDDLIAGATGIRRSKIGQLKTASNKFRNDALSGGAEFGLAARKNRGAPPPAGHKYAVIPTLNEPNIIQVPPTITKENGRETEFTNYIHFRSLERRSKQDGDERWDIFLYVPDTLNDNLAVTYTEAELGIVDSLISNAVKSDQVQSGYGVDKAEAAAMAIAMAGPAGGKMIQSSQGRGVNPLKYQLFENVAFRTFSYAFTLRPKTQKEASEINKMLYVFKREALPGVAGANSRIYTFPTEWSIQFVGQIKKFVDFPLVSVCTGVNVDYAGGQPLALHHDGAPSVVTLTLNFTETTQLNRTKYDDYVSSFKSWETRSLGEQERGTNINAATIQAQREAAAAAVENTKRENYHDRGHELHPWDPSTTPGTPEYRQKVKKYADEINESVGYDPSKPGIF